MEKTAIKPVETKKKSFPIFKTPIGIGGEMMVTSMYKLEERRVDDLKITDYRRMVDNDGQIQMLWNAIVNTILAAGFSFNDDEEIETEEDSEELQFVQKNLTAPAWKNGMAKPIDLINRVMLRAYVEGFRVFEVLYRVGEDGKIYLDRLDPRAGKTDSEFYLLVDDQGNWLGYKQKVLFNSRIVDVEVRNDSEIKKVIKATYGEEFGSNYGRSGFKAAWYHYDKAHKGMYLNHVGHELGTVKFRNVMLSTAIPDEQKTNIAAILNRIHLEPWMIYDKNVMELTFEDVTDAKVMAIGKEMINYHTSMMAKSVLAQFIDLGSNISETGSRSTEEGQQAFFRNGLQSVAEILIERPWNEVIADLVKINFNRGIYPTIKVNPISKEASNLILSAFSEMVKKGTIPSSLQAELLGTASDTLGLDVTQETITEELEQEKQEKKEEQEMILNSKQAMLGPKGMPQPPAAKPTKKVNMTGSHATLPHIHLEEDIMEEVAEVPTISRDLFPDEEKVRFVDIRRRFEEDTQNAERILGAKLAFMRDQIVNQYLKALREGRKAVNKVTVELAEGSQSKYSEELMMLILNMAEFGKVMAANELNAKVATTTKKVKQELTDMVDAAVEEQTARLQLKLKTVANESLQNNRPENETMLRLEDEYMQFFDTVLGPTLGILVPKAYNIGRGVTFMQEQANIFAYRYTAVLDRRTTRYCRSMDGRVFQPNDPNYFLVSPPNHFGCRSQWTPITYEEAGLYGTIVTGKPGDLPTYSSPNTFKDVGRVSMSETETKTTEIEKELTDIYNKS